MTDSRKKIDESAEEVSQNTAAQVEDVPSLIQKTTELEARVYSLKQTIVEHFIAKCNVNEESVTYENAVKSNKNHASANPPPAQPKNKICKWRAPRAEQNQEATML